MQSLLYSGFINIDIDQYYECFTSLQFQKIKYGPIDTIEDCMMPTTHLHIEQNRSIHLPNIPELRHRLNEKLFEYRNRVERLKKMYREEKTGVVIDRDNNILDAIYKAEIVSELLNKHDVNIGQLYDMLQSQFKGYVADEIFLNAISVIDDYLRTGGIHTEGGTVFFTNELLNKLLEEASVIEYPEDAIMRAQIQSKYHEYVGRNVDYEQSSESTIDRAAMKRNTYKIRILSELRKNSRVIVKELAQEITNEEGKIFDRLEFYNAVSQVVDLLKQIRSNSESRH